MKRLSKEKRNQLITVSFITLAVLGAAYFGLIRPQYASLSKIARDTRAAEKQLRDIKNTITSARTVTNDLSQTTLALAKIEADMASGDLYSWTYDTLRRFKQPYKVEIPDVGHPTIGEMDLLPAFPYKQIRIGINGTGYYHDLGRFVADFENNFPHARVVNLVVEPMAGADGGNEKLTFKMEIIALVKTNPS